jgi:hypothetical protein
MSHSTFKMWRWCEGMDVIAHERLGDSPVVSVQFAPWRKRGTGAPWPSSKLFEMVSERRDETTELVTTPIERELVDERCILEHELVDVGCIGNE